MDVKGALAECNKSTATICHGDFSLIAINVYLSRGIIDIAIVASVDATTSGFDIKRFSIHINIGIFVLGDKAIGTFDGDAFRIRSTNVGCGGFAEAIVTATNRNAVVGVCINRDVFAAYINSITTAVGIRDFDSTIDNSVPITGDIGRAAIARREDATIDGGFSNRGNSNVAFAFHDHITSHDNGIGGIKR
ncbi:MAG: hypothetical protein IKY97_06170 [Mailhella sp.]|nr:hypothetical protein [Mailhella sp.]